MSKFLEKEKLYGLIEANKIEEAIEKLVELTKHDSDLANHAIMTYGQYKSFNRQRSIGIISLGEQNIVLNRIRRSLLYIVDELEDSSLRDQGETLKSLNSTIKLILDKTNFLRKRRLIETDASVKFKLDHELQQLEKELHETRQRMRFAKQDF